MLLANLSREPLRYMTELSPIEVHEKRFGHSPIEKASAELRFFHSASPLEIVVEGKSHFITERSVVKLHPGREISVNMEKGATLYEIAVSRPEQEILDALQKKHTDFFLSLEGTFRKEWDEVSGKETDYVGPEEPNSQHILKLPGMVIAPPFSRFKNNTSSGWNMMYMRGSRALGVGSNNDFRMRSAEAQHTHMITTEIYLCMGGSADLSISGKRQPITLRKGDCAVAEPGEVHFMEKLIETPYRGITLQLPSIPGDKYTPEGQRMAF